MHLDIKPDNILMSPSGHLALADFGQATKVVNGRTDDSLIKFSLGYGAPEVIARGLFGDRGVTQAADVWGMAIVIIVMFRAYPASPYWFQGTLEAARMNVVGNEEVSMVLTSFETLISDPMWLPELKFLKNYVPDLHDLLSKVRLAIYVYQHPFLTTLFIDADKKPKGKVDVPCTQGSSIFPANRLEQSRAMLT